VAIVFSYARRNFNAIIYPFVRRNGDINPWINRIRVVKVTVATRIYIEHRCTIPPVALCPKAAMCVSICADYSIILSITIDTVILVKSILLCKK